MPVALYLHKTSSKLSKERDPDFARRIGATTALEVRASGIHYAFAPCVAVMVHHRYKVYVEEMTSLVINFRVSIMVKLREKSWFASSLRSQLQYLVPNPGLPSLSEEIHAQKYL